MPIYVFSGSRDPIGQNLEGVRLLLDRYRKAGINDVSHRFYPGGRHEMLNEINQDEVRAHLLGWIDAALEKQAGSRAAFSKGARPVERQELTTERKQRVL